MCFVAQHCSIYWITIAMVPQMPLYSESEMPAIGLGTFGSNHVTAAEYRMDQRQRWEFIRVLGGTLHR